MRVLTTTFIVTVMLLAWARADGGAAEGALAIGQPSNVVKDGYAFGWSTNRKSGDEARSGAIGNCRSYDGVELRVRELCKIVRTFKAECVAVALDPEAGTPGVGWAVDPVKQQAEELALRECRLTAGASRRKYCGIAASGCDGPAQ